MNWFNFDKMENMLKNAGFSIIHKSNYKQSQFEELRGKEFDNTHPEMSLYVEAIKKEDC